MDNPDLIELLESEFDFLINKAHKSGLSYKQIFILTLERLKALVMQSDMEHLMKQ